MTYCVHWHYKLRSGFSNEEEGGRNAKQVACIDSVIATTHGKIIALEHPTWPCNPCRRLKNQRITDESTPHLDVMLSISQHASAGAVESAHYAPVTYFSYIRQLRRRTFRSSSVSIMSTIFNMTTTCFSATWKNFNIKSGVKSTKTLLL